MVPVVPSTKRHFFQIGGPMLVSLPLFKGRECEPGKADSFLPGDQKNATLPATTANRSTDEPKAATDRNALPGENVGRVAMPEPCGRQEGPPQQARRPDARLEALAAVDYNIESLLFWGLVPRLEGGQLVLDGIADMEPEDRDGVERWLAHGSWTSETRKDRIVRALQTGRKTALC